LVSPGALSPFHGLRRYRKKRPPLAVTVCRQNLPFHLAFSTCENKSLSRFSYRSGERPQEWERIGGRAEGRRRWLGRIGRAEGRKRSQDEREEWVEEERNGEGAEGRGRGQK